MQSQHSQLTRALEADPELLRLAEDQPADGANLTEPLMQEKTPTFPEAAWRGIFGQYREAMRGVTEASDAYHFAALWARCAVALGRRVSCFLALDVYPNVYLVCFGPTGDRKTTATRCGASIGLPYKRIDGGGSGEGLADEFSEAEPGQGFLLYAEEFSQILRPGQWQGSTLKPFLTQCFDCPDHYEAKFRKNPIALDQPTPSLLAATTPDWFWQDFSARDFQGGFGNRILFLTGARKPDIPLPEKPELESVASAVDALKDIAPCQARFDPAATELWTKFYRAWNAEDPKRDSLLLAAVQRIPTYVSKLAMVYASAEHTLPHITAEQLRSAILVGRYAETCARELLALQHSGTNPRKELESRILTFVNAQPGRTTKKRDLYRALHRHYSDAEMFERAFSALVRAGELFTASHSRGSVLVSTEPLL